MYVGHVAAALGGKGLRPAIPLWFLILAAQAPDWIVIAARLSGHEIDPVEGFTETSLSFVVIAVPLALAWLAYSRDLHSALIVWLVAASHPICDFFTGTRTLLPGSIAPGLGWYRRPVHDFAIETLFLCVGALIYRRSLSERAKRSTTFILMIVSLVFIQASIDLYLASSRRNGWLSNEINSARLFH